MDSDNDKLKRLLEDTDVAFQALMENPTSSELSRAYDDAKSALDCYLADMRSTLEKRYKF